MKVFPQENPLNGTKTIKQCLADEEFSGSEEVLVSFHAELPIALRNAMAGFIERYPNWDQYRLIQAALAGFLVQNGVDSREITRLYVGNMFGCNSFTS